MKFPRILDLFPYIVIGQESKVKSTDTRAEDQGDSLFQMLGQCGVVLSQIRKLQGSGYPSLLFSLEPRIKGGSKSSKQIDDVESAHVIVATEDAITAIASKERLIPEDSLADPGALNNVDPNEIREGGGLADMETMSSDETSKVRDNLAAKCWMANLSTPGLHILTSLCS